jgi:hypothetical protein
MWVGSTLQLFMGMPVALTFLGINIIGAVLYMCGEPGLVQLVRNRVSEVSAFAFTPIALFVLMGEIRFHTFFGRESDRRGRALDRSRARALSGGGGGGDVHGVLAISGSTMGHTFLTVTPYMVMSLLLLKTVVFVPGIAT